jgi:hypothetical protein
MKYVRLGPGTGAVEDFEHPSGAPRPTSVTASKQCESRMAGAVCACVHTRINE